MCIKIYMYVCKYGPSNFNPNLAAASVLDLFSIETEKAKHSTDWCVPRSKESTISLIARACSCHLQTPQLVSRNAKRAFSVITRACSRHIQAPQDFPRNRKTTISREVQACSHHLQAILVPTQKGNEQFV